MVVPTYRSTQSLRELARLIPGQLDNYNFEIIFVDDGSPPNTWSVIEDLCREDSRIRGIRLGRNSGQHAALLAGIRLARYEWTLTIDDDLQQPPDQIPLLIAQLTDSIDVVYGYPSEVAQSLFRRSASRIFRTLLSRLMNESHTLRSSSFSLFRTRLRDAFSIELGPGVSIGALLNWATQHQSFVEVRHDERAYSSSNYRFWSLFRVAFEVVVGFSTVPLRLALRIGFLTIIFGLFALAWVLGRLLLTGESIAGFPFLASTITIFAGVQLFSLGILGEYVASIHQRTMHKPTYFIAEIIGDPPIPK